MHTASGLNVVNCGGCQAEHQLVFANDCYALPASRCASHSRPTAPTCLLAVFFAVAACRRIHALAAAANIADAIGVLLAGGCHAALLVTDIPAVHIPLIGVLNLVCAADRVPANA